MLASGRIRLVHALAMCRSARRRLCIAWHLSMGFAAYSHFMRLMIGYLCDSRTYVVDVLVLAAICIAGAAGGGVEIRVSALAVDSLRLLVFSLALIKRYAELVVLESAASAARTRTRLRQPG